MKQNFYNIIACTAAILLLAACEKSGDLPGSEPGGDSIILDFSAGSPGKPGAASIPKVSGASDASGVPGSSGVSGTSGASSRSIADNEMESRVDHIDVLIFEGQEPYAKAHYERIVTSGRSSNGKVALTAKKSSFTKDKNYLVYLIANANDEDQETFKNAANRNAFFSMWHKDRYIHLTGLPLDSSSDIALPQTFLMDGVAYDSGTEPTKAQPVVLNTGDTYENIFLYVTLRRAAVKLVLKIEEGDNVTFHNIASESGTVTSGGYYLRNMPWTTLISAVAPEDSKGVLVRTTSQSRTSYYQMGSNPETGKKMITVTAYVYSNSWERESSVEREPRWILDIPLTYTAPNPDPDRDPSGDYINGNYYQIPVCGGSRLERNTCYTVSLTLNRPGGTEPTKPLELTEIRYEVAGWDDTTVNIGGEDELPKFLTVNRTEMEMHNIDKDETTLRFASSSAVTATVTRAYYRNKYNNEENVSETIFNAIKATPDDGLNGSIKIESPSPTNNTARYITVEVTNEEEITRTIEIVQYPLINITNIQGWYSYRSDFGGTTWENYVNPTEKRVTAYGFEYDPETDTGTWKYSGTDYGGNISVWQEVYDNKGNLTSVYRKEYGEPIFFTSMVAEEVLDDETYKGRSSISRYTYYTNTTDISWWNRWEKDWIPGDYLITHPVYKTGNARMYHVEVTATSKKYTIGRPRITNGKTDKGEDNAKLVSPSFMIASQLGVVPTTSFEGVEDDKAYAMAASHCEKYVEVAKKGTERTVYDDWRLPTAAEIGIIIDLQYNTAEGAAMDEVMAGYKYFSASGIVINERTTNYEYEKDKDGKIIKDENGNPIIKKDEKGNPVIVDRRYIRCIRDDYKTQETGKEADPAAGNQ